MLDVFDLQYGIGFIGGMNDDGAHAENSLAEGDGDGDVPNPVEYDFIVDSIDESSVEE
jgi:hypothetical protein